MELKYSPPLETDYSPEKKNEKTISHCLQLEVRWTQDKSDVENTYDTQNFG